MSFKTLYRPGLSKKAEKTFQERWYQGDIQISAKFSIHLIPKEQIINQPTVNMLHHSLFVWQTIFGRDRGNDKNTVEATSKSRV